MFFLCFIERVTEDTLEHGLWMGSNESTTILMTLHLYFYLAIYLLHQTFLKIRSTYWVCGSWMNLQRESEQYNTSTVCIMIMDQMIFDLQDWNARVTYPWVAWMIIFIFVTDWVKFVNWSKVKRTFVEMTFFEPSSVSRGIFTLYGSFGPQSSSQPLQQVKPLWNDDYTPAG